MEARGCPICETPTKTILSGIDYQGYPILRCDGCGLRLLGTEGVSAPFRRDPVEEAWRFATVERLWSHRLDRLARLAPGRRLLDVGCSSGRCARIAKARGWSVTGIEPNPQAGRFAREGGIEVHPGGYETFPGGIFDAVICSQVLEHLDRPMEVLDQIRGWTGRGGVLLLSVPNAASLSARWKDLVARTGLSHRPYRHLGAPRHVWYFTPRTLRSLCRRSGWNLLHEEGPPHAFPPQIPYYSDAVRGLLGRVGLAGTIDLYLTPLR